MPLLEQLQPVEAEVTQDQIEKEILVEHLPFGSINDPFAPITFYMPFSDLECWCMPDTILRLRVEYDISGPNNVAPTWTEICPVNMLFHSMIKNIDLEINGKLITSSSQYYPYLAHLQTKLRITDDVKKGVLTNAFYYDDDTTDKDTIVEARNKRLKPTTATSKKSKTIGMASKLFLDIFSQPKLLIGGVTAKLVIYPVLNPKFYFMTKSEQVSITPKIKDCTLYTTRSIIRPEVRQQHLSMLSRGPFQYNYTRNEIKTFNLPSGINEKVSDNLILGELPRRVFMAMVDHDTFTGNNFKNPFNFEHFNVNFIQLRANDLHVPTRPLCPNWDNDLYERTYNSVFEALNDMSSDACYTMSYENFKNGNVIVGFNLSSDTSDGQLQSGYTNPKRNGNLVLDLKFKNNLTKNITVLLWLQYDARMNITKDFEVLTNFN